MLHRLPLGVLLLLLPETFNGMPESPEEPGRCLLDLPPSRDIVLPHIDIVPTHETVHRGVVQLVINDGSPVIFDGILRSSDCDDKY